MFSINLENMKKAQQEIRSLLNGQWKNGFIPHIIFHNESDTYFPGPEVYAASLSKNSPEIPTSGITQPPVTGFILEEMYGIAEDKEDFLTFLDEVYEAIYKNHEYFYTRIFCHNCINYKMEDSNLFQFLFLKQFR